MSKDERLSPAGSSTITEFREKSDAIVAAVASRSREAENSPSSEGNRETVVERMKYAQKTVESFLAVPSVALISEHMAWLVDRVPRESVSIAAFIEGLRIHKEAVAQVLSAPAAEEVLPYFDFMISEIERISDQGEG